MKVWNGSFTGKLPRVNEWHGARCIAGHGRIFETTKYKHQKADLAIAFRSRSVPISTPVDMVIELSLWKMRDTDGPIKGIMDALELAGVIENDRLIRDITIRRLYHKRDSADRLKVMLLSPEAGGL